MGLARLALRGTIGALFVGHGLQKLTGQFGGEGLEGTARNFERLGLRPGMQHARAAGLAETGGGALLALGLATPAAVAALSGSMFTAIRTVHWRNGPWVTRGGYEYNLVLLGALAALAEEGPGRLSLDALRGRQRKGVVWAVGALGAGALASTLALRWAERHAATQQEAPAAAVPVEHAAPAERPAPARPVERREPVGAL